MTYKIGDIVKICVTKDLRVCSRTNPEKHSTLDCTIIGIQTDEDDGSLEYIYFPIHQHTIKANASFFILDNDQVNDWRSDKHYKLHNSIHVCVNQLICWRNENVIDTFIIQDIIIKKKISGPDGSHCAHCKEFSPYAESGFTCWSCRQDPFRLSVIKPDD